MLQAEQSKRSKIKDQKEGSGISNSKNDGAVTTSRDARIHTLSIIGQIEGHYFLPEGQKATKYEHIIPELVEIEESDEVDGLLMILNTMGATLKPALP